MFFCENKNGKKKYRHSFYLGDIHRLCIGHDITNWFLQRKEIFLFADTQFSLFFYARWVIRPIFRWPSIVGSGRTYVSIPPRCAPFHPQCGRMGRARAARNRKRNSDGKKVETPHVMRGGEDKLCTKTEKNKRLRQHFHLPHWLPFPHTRRWCMDGGAHLPRISASPGR